MGNRSLPHQPAGGEVCQVAGTYEYRSLLQPVPAEKIEVGQATVFKVPLWPGVELPFMGDNVAGELVAVAVAWWW